MSAPVVRWICEELSNLLGFEATEDIAKYILAIETEKDLEEYMQDLLEPSVPRNKRFIKKLLEKWRPPPRKVEGPSENVKVYRKSDDIEYVHGKDKAVKTKTKALDEGSQLTKENVEKNLKSLGMDDTPKPIEDMNGFGDVETESMMSNTTSASTRSRKSKFVNLFSEKGLAKSGAKIPGRHTCECQAVKHKLVNNCVGCGRVVCEQEGSGPCMFCDTLVCTNEEGEMIARGSKKGEKLKNYLMKDQYKGLIKDSEEKLEKAIAHKNRLLEYDRTSARRTKVIDDESDYFSSDSQWLSKKDREKLKKREEELRAIKHASRKDRKITLDFAGRRVIEEGGDVDLYNINDSVVQEVHYGAKPKSKTIDLKQEDFIGLVNPTLEQPPPLFIPSDGPYSKKVSNPTTAVTNNIITEKRTVRLQDCELQQMSDDGMCLSMHQPWASLLVKGIKIHEGRTWYTPHRGRLWIAATAKKPTAEEIADLEQAARFTSAIPLSDSDFPREYPVACLLGCVDVSDCLAQDEYRLQYPTGESGSPYVLICNNPQELIVKFPIKGKHKIYKLEAHVHQGAKKGLRKVVR
ncbi:unnamed protein product [Owenia fusiformis]|uniref:Uncharacterized protein n=1 Tax=Owenia fusiformis TaxID=6347 RepID=A0A8J1TXV5_OWEFU|nr:unnamed protein product [Owenia fusiformis]